DIIATGRGESEGTLASGEGLIIGTSGSENGREKAQDMSQSPRVVKGRGEGRSFTQMRPHTLLDTEPWAERRAQGKPEINGLLACSARLRQMRQGAECLLAGCHGLTISRPCHGFLPSLPAVRQRLRPQLAAQGMVRQAFCLLGHAVSSER